MANPQILVVGAGPVGLTMAAELARYGVTVRVVEKSAERTDKSKALVIWGRTLEHLERAGCVDLFVQAGHQVRAANIIAKDKRIGHLDLTIVDSAFNYALMLPQSETERLLEEHLASLNVVVERQVELSDFEDVGNGVRATLKHADGREEVVHADWLIGCDGAHSTVRHLLGMSFVGDTLQSDWVLADIHLKGVPFPDTEISTYWHEDGVLVVFPISPGRYRIVADLGQAEGSQQPDRTLEEIQAILERRGPEGLVASEPVWLTNFRINERKIASYRSGRVFLAGDAAHIHSPAGGQGMNTGMQDAFNLAWKLALVCAGHCPDGKLLDSYSVERSAVGEEVLTAAGRLTAIGILKNHTAQTIRNLIGSMLFGLTSVQQAVADNMSEVSIGYPHSPLNGRITYGLDAPGPGERAKPIKGQQPFGAGNRPLCALCAPPQSEADRLIATFPTLLERIVRPPLGEGAIWLVRPDGYVALTAKDYDLGGIADYLESFQAGGDLR